MPKNILHTIEKNMSSFSKGQKLIARFILEDYDKAAFMTASKLGKTVQVSESTVVRFATQLGYDGYPSMQRALQEMIRGKLTGVKTLPVRPCVSRELGMGLHPREQLPPGISRLRECVLEYIGEL